MKLLKKYVSGIVIAAILTGLMPVIFAEGESAEIASVVLGEDVKKSNVSSVKMGTNSTITLNNRGGRTGWLLSGSGTTSSQINIDLDDKFVNGNSDGSAYTVEVDYLDADKSVFGLVYDSIDDEAKEADLVYLDVSQVWKTAVFELDDANFGNRLDGSDLRIAIRSKKIRVASGNVLVGGVRVTKHPSKNPVQVKSLRSGELGNIFGNGENKSFTAEFINYSNEVKTFDVEYKAVSESGALIWSATDKVTANAGEAVSRELTVEADKYGLYTLTAELKGDGYTHKKTAPFSFVDSIEDGTKNDKFGYNVHFTWDGYSAKDGLEVIEKSNAGFVRNSLQWHMIDPNDGVKFSYSMPEKYMEIIEALGNSNVGLQLLLSYGNPEYGGKTEKHMPVTEEEVRGFVGYVEFLIKEMKSHNAKIQSYEVWNEPNLVSFNADGATGTQYGELAIETIKAIRKYDTEGEIGVMSPANMRSSSTMDFVKEALGTGVAEYSNVLTLHPYSHGEIPEVGRIPEIQSYIDLYTEVLGYAPRLHNTEIGYSTYRTPFTDSETGQAKVNMRTYILYLAKGLGDTFTFYDFANDGGIKTYIEHNFGHVHSEIPGVADVRYAAKAAFVADACLNKRLQNADVVKKVVEENDSYAYVFKREKDNALVMPVWTSHEPRMLSFKTNADKLTVYDMYGNAETVYGKDGVFSLNLTDSVQYVEGDLEGITVTDNPVEVSRLKLSAAAGSEFEIGVRSNIGDGLTAKLEAENSMKIVSGETVLGESEMLKVAIPDIPDVETSIKVKVMDGDKTAFLYSVPVETTGEIISCKLLSVPSGSDLMRWKYKAIITNNKEGAPIEGTLKINSPKLLADDLAPVAFRTIPGGTSGEITFNSSRLPRLGMYTVDYTVTTKSGEVYSFKDNVGFTVAKYAQMAPKIDGVFEDAEWDNQSTMYSTEIEQVYMSGGYSWGGTSDLSAKTMIMVDDEALYVAIDATDDTHFAEDTDSNIWRNDSVQFGVVFEQKVTDNMVGGTFTEIGMGTSPTGNVVWRYSSEDNNLPAGKVEGADVAIRREGAHTYYELKLPWNEITIHTDKVKEISQVGFSMLINDNDGQGRKGWIEYGSGIGKSKDTTLFTFLNIVGK